MEEPRERRDRACPVCGAVHDRGVELDHAEDVRFAAAADARVARIGFDDLRAGLDRVECRSAASQDADTGR